MKKSTLALLTTVIAFSPLSALAQDAQTSIQTNSNSTAVVGNGNGVLQNATQNSVQKSIDLDEYLPTTPNAQTSVQGNVNSAAAVGHGNGVVQNATQNSAQGQVDVNQYLPQNYRY